MDIPMYAEEVAGVAALPLPWEKLRDKTVLVTGGTGLIGRFLVDILRAAGAGCRLLLAGRSEARARERFADCWDEDFLRFVRHDFGGEEPFSPAALHGETPAHILHLASQTHPEAYASNPVATIVLNVLATKQLLDLAADAGAKRFVFASSNEIYGENRGGADRFGEHDCGYIDCNTLRAGYPESKRCGEALCQAYIAQKGVDCVIARITRTYGATVLDGDSKASSQFFRDVLAGRDVVLKSDGLQQYSFLYLPDTVSGLLTAWLAGKCGEAYNIADERSDVTLRQMAEAVAAAGGRKVVAGVSGATERKGASVVTKALLSGEKLKALGWHAAYGIREGVARTLAIRKAMAGQAGR